MAWKQAEVRIIGGRKARSGSISRRMLFIWCMLASSILYLTPQSASNKLQLAFAHIFRFPLSAGGSFSLSARVQQQLNDVVSRKEYITLQNQYNNLDQDLAKLREQFDRLYGLRNSYPNKNVDFILGYIIPAKADPLRNELTIHCLGTNGLKEGRFVLAEDNSIIGRITDVSTKTQNANVKLITHSDSIIFVTIDRIDRKLKMQGNGNNTAKIVLVPKEVNIKVGMNVFSVPQSGLLDAPMIVGTVSECKTDDKNPLFLDITVTPSWKIKPLDDVAIIITNPSK